MCKEKSNVIRGKVFPDAGKMNITKMGHAIQHYKMSMTFTEESRDVTEIT
jgi:hypothetical protein